MAIIHKATLSPSKLELLTSYVSGIPELATFVAGELEQVGAYRFDDPAGHVGIETHILTSENGTFLQIPVVYRNEALPGADAFLVGTMEHSVLGQRWVYDACIDPVYVEELLTTIATGGTEVAELIETPDGPVPRDPSVNVRGSGDGEAPRLGMVVTKRNGTESHISAGDLTVIVRHVLDESAAPTGLHLTGTWAGNENLTTLATMD